MEKVIVYDDPPKVQFNRKLKIAISGKSGCGNTTTTRLLARYLGYKVINYTFHNIAEERGIDFKELCLMAESDPSWDYYLDDQQKELAADGACVLGSRLAIWILRDADLRVYLTAEPDVRAKRIQKRESGDLDRVKRDTLERDRRDRERYKKLYNIDNDDFAFADLIIHTDDKEPEEIVGLILDELIRRYNGIHIS